MKKIGKLDKHLYEAYETGYQAARMALLDINVLGCSAASAGRVVYVIEYKRWYGTGPGDSRWQRVGITCDAETDLDSYKYLIDRVAKIREALEDETGIPQDVRY